MYPPYFAYDGGIEGNLSLKEVPFGTCLCGEIGHLIIVLGNLVLPLRKAQGLQKEPISAELGSLIAALLTHISTLALINSTAAIFIFNGLASMFLKKLRTQMEYSLLLH